ncbi:hypothetical protein LCGC14_2191790, partial [marine sediment metagenome]
MFTSKIYIIAIFSVLWSIVIAFLLILLPYYLNLDPRITSNPEIYYGINKDIYFYLRLFPLFIFTSWLAFSGISLILFSLYSINLIDKEKLSEVIKKTENSIKDVKEIYLEIYEIKMMKKNVERYSRFYFRNSAFTIIGLLMGFLLFYIYIILISNEDIHSIDILISNLDNLSSAIMI